ncbi:hypothetical protein GUITHDRAFT_141332 [Guillardia theta CCMP2712]|uniref:Uncharacterized protein n=1 Tax=Guillardia theta (strain CCMP2712) TaxID=905079 RepID=L1J2S0_GUITC|nr:hypothetical protein GUITHDRAFT_141332 [Guillardia theta CCMP2712]EKX42390.1 hypothetical protein GUITHDRAFT_141332 [Guillardia theta CCMP2712]|eukprot:XP_005829370.1 hypothetical protein GUITHDRAFT_141332 [Guillardia theta CCMP2712]
MRPSDVGEQEFTAGEMLTLASRIRNGESVDQTLFSLLYHRFPQGAGATKRSSPREESLQPPPSSPGLPPREPPRVLYQRWSVRSIKDGLLFGEPRAPPSISLPSEDKATSEEARRALEESILKLVLEEVAAGLEQEEQSPINEWTHENGREEGEEDGKSEQQKARAALPDFPGLLESKKPKQTERTVEPATKIPLEDTRRRRMREDVLAYMGPEHRKLMMNVKPQQDISDLLEPLEVFKQKLVREALDASCSPLGRGSASLSELETASFHADASVRELLEDPKIFQLVKKSVIRRLEGKRR